MFGIEKDFQVLMEEVYGPLGKKEKEESDRMAKQLVDNAVKEVKEMTDEIDISKVIIEGDTATIMGVKYKRVEEPKSPVEEAYKRVYGVYPMTDDTDGHWENFQAGYKSAQKDYKVGEWEPTPQTPEQVADGLKEAFREAVKNGIIPEVDKVSDEFMDKMVAKLKGQTLTDLIYDWWEDVFTTNSNDDMGICVDTLVDRIEEWLPKEQSAAGSQNVYVQCTVEGFNDALNKVKRNLR